MAATGNRFVETLPAKIGGDLWKRLSCPVQGGDNVM
jgi:hypothetical protein